MAHHASSAPELAPVSTESRVDERKQTDREDLRVQLLLGSLAFGSILWSVLSYVRPFG